MAERTGFCIIQIPSIHGHDTVIFDRQNKDIAEEDRKDFEVISCARAQIIFINARLGGGAVFTRTNDERDLHKVKYFEELEDWALIRPQIGGG
jgi:hypothetical protein